MLFACLRTSLPTWSGHGDKGVEGDIWFFPGPGGGGGVVKVIGPGGKVAPPPGKTGGDDPGGGTVGSDTLYPVADSYVYAYSYRNWNKSNRGAYDILSAGWHPTGGESRAYLKFDLSGVDPQGMNKAKLRLFHYHTGGGHILKLGVHKVTGRWIEGRGTYHSGQTEKPAAPGEITWVAQPPFENSAVASFSPGAGTNKYVEVDVTELVKGWLSGKPNYGLVITPMGTLGPGTRESAYGFFSREREDKTKRPVLNVQSAGGTDTPVDRLRVRAEDRQVKPDASVTVPIWLEFPKSFPRTRDGRVNVANLNVEIEYDPSVAKPVGDVIAGNLLGSAIFQANIARTGLIKIGFATKQGVRTDGTLAQIPFQVVGQAGQRSPVNVKITTVNDDKGGTPAAVAIHGSIQIIKAGVIGDINGNGIVDAGDALAARKMSVDLREEDLILNVDKQNGVTSNDARLLLKMAVQGNATTPGTVGSGGRPSVTSPATPANNSASGGNVAPPSPQPPKSVAARKAYQEYIAAYNKMTSLMAKGQGDTPAAQQAYQEYKKAKDKYDAAIKDAPPPVSDESSH